MFDDNKKLIGIVGIILVVLIITTAAILKLKKSPEPKEPESVESVVESETPTPTPIIKEEVPEIDENLLLEAEDFLNATKTMAEKVEEPEEKFTPEGELKRKAIASVLDIWDVENDTIKDDATTQKLKFAEATVAQTEESLSDKPSNSELISKLKEILRRAEEEFARRQQEQAEQGTEPPTEETPTETGAEPTTPPAETPSETPTETSQPAQPTATPTPTPTPTQQVRPTQVVQPTPTPTQQTQPTQQVQQQTTQVVATQPKKVLYDWVAGTAKASQKAITEENPYPYSKLPDTFKKSLDTFRRALNKTEDTVVLEDQNYGFTESLTLIQAIDDIYFPYVRSGIAVMPHEDDIIISGMINARKAYKENQEIKKEIEKEADKLKKNNLTEKQAVIDINNYITKKLHCDENTKAFSLKAGTANCRGYAATFRDMCHRLGIKCDVVYGVIGTDTQGHAWNRVTVDGKQYYCDAVWNDGGSDEYPFMFAEQEWYGRQEQYPVIDIDASTLAVLEKEYKAEQTDTDATEFTEGTEDLEDSEGNDASEEDEEDGDTEDKDDTVDDTDDK